MERKKVNITSCIAIAALIFAALLITTDLFRVQISSLYNESEMIYNIMYVPVQNPGEVETNKNNMIPAEKLSSISADRTGEYIYVTCDIKATDELKQLTVYTFFNQIKIKLNNSLQVDRLSFADYYSKTSIETINIPKSDAPAKMEMLIRTAYNPTVRIADGICAPISYLTTPFIMSGLLLIIMLICCIVAVRKSAEIKNERYRMGMYVAAASMFTLTIGILCVFYSTYMMQGGVIISGLGMVTMMMAGIGVLYFFSEITDTPNSLRQGLVSVGLFYIIFFLINRYNIFGVSLIKMFGAFYLIGTAIIVILLIKAERDIIISKTAATICFLFDFIYANYWLGVMGLGYEIKVGMLIFAACVFTFIVATTILKNIKNENESGVMPERLMTFKPKNLGELDNTLSKFLKSKDNARHVRNVSLYVNILCLKAGMDSERAEFVAKAAFLHDIGKVNVKEEIVEKTGILTNSEYEMIKMHAQYGYDILSAYDCEFIHTAAEIAKYHHERIDGKGYFGKQESEIGQYAQITGIADVFDAITTERAYKNAWSFNEGFNYIVNQGGNMFSAQYIKLFEESKYEIYKVYCETRN